MMERHRENPQGVFGWRAKTIGLGADGQLLPYNKWPMRTSADPSLRVFMAGVSGVLYPPAVLEEARSHGTGFMEVCPNGDDIWLHRSTIRAGATPAQVSDTFRDLPNVPFAQRTSLMATNLNQGDNDAQITATYSDTDVALIAADARP